MIADGFCIPADGGPTQSSPGLINATFLSMRLCRHIAFDGQNGHCRTRMGSQRLTGHADREERVIPMGFTDAVSFQDRNIHDPPDFGLYCLS